MTQEQADEGVKVAEAPITVLPQNEANVSADKRLGKLPAKSDVRTLMFSRFNGVDKVPAANNYWAKKAPFTYETWGNTTIGDCTVAKQANMFRRFERIERRQTIHIATDEVTRVYYAMTQELYGGGDTGAYEEDALSRSRNPETCLHDSAGHPLLIDAFVRLNPFDHDELRSALFLAKGHGIAICINLPWGFASIDPPNPWDIPEGQELTGAWMPGSWGGHSMFATGYTKEGIILEHTWGIAPQLLTWRAAAVYLDEAHLVIDSVNAWKKKTKGKLDIDGIVKAVNKVSRTKIKA